MYKNYKLSHFFMLVALFLVCVISLIAYGWRRNAPSNKWDDNGDMYSSSFKEKGVDVSTPFYENAQSATMDKEAAKTRSNADTKDVDGVDFPEKGTIDSSAVPQVAPQNAPSPANMTNSQPAPTQNQAPAQAPKH